MHDPEVTPLDRIDRVSEEQEARRAARDALAAVFEQTCTVAGDPDLLDHRSYLLPLLGHLHDQDVEAAVPPGRWLARQLVDWPAGDEDRRRALTVFLSRAVCQLAPGSRSVPERARADVWDAVLLSAHQLNGSGHAILGQAGIGQGRLEQLITEASELRPLDDVAQARSVGRRRADPGPELRALAVDRGLLAAASRAIGLPLRPAYRAVYNYYEQPGAHVPPHLDVRSPVAVLFMLEHVFPSMPCQPSTLVLHSAGAEATRLALAPGEAVVFRGGGTVHGREPVAEGERVTTGLVNFLRDEDGS